MPVPKRKLSRSRRDMRSSGKFIRAKSFAECPQCSHPSLPHMVCERCGYFKGRKIMTTNYERAVHKKLAASIAAEKAKAAAQESQSAE